MIITGRMRTMCGGWALLVLSVLLPGCTPQGPKLVPVTGVVQFDGGPCPAAGTVFFLPLETAGGAVTRPGTAEFQTDGKFTVKSYQPGDGLLPGKYKINVECWAVPPNMEGKPIQSHLPADYQAKHPETWEVTISPQDPSRQLTLNVETR